MNVAFFESITPYWVSLQEYLYKRYNFNMYFIKREYLNYDMDALRCGISFTPNYLELENINPKISMNKSKNSWRIKELYRIIKENKPKLVLTVEFSLLTIQLILIKYLTFKNYKIIIRTDDSYYLMQHGWTFKHVIARKFVSFFSDAFILCDKRVFEIYEQKDKLSMYFPIIQDEKVLRHNLQLSIPISNKYIEDNNLLGKKVVLFVGRLIELKNVGILIEALRRIKDDDAVLVVVGSGDGSPNDREREWKNQANQSGLDVIFTGHLTGFDLIAWYNIASVLVLPSLREAFGAVVNEALVAGSNCIVSDSAGSASIIKDGQNGYVFESNNIDDLQQCLIKCLSCEKIKNIEELRENKMLFTFDEILESVGNKIARMAE